MHSFRSTQTKSVKCISTIIYKEFIILCSKAWNHITENCDWGFWQLCKSNQNTLDSQIYNQALTLLFSFELQIYSFWLSIGYHLLVNGHLLSKSVHNSVFPYFPSCPVSPSWLLMASFILSRSYKHWSHSQQLFTTLIFSCSTTPMTSNFRHR